MAGAPPCRSQDLYFLLLVHPGCDADFAGGTFKVFRLNVYMVHTQAAHSDSVVGASKLLNFLSIIAPYEPVHLWAPFEPV
jgi:hypothetical protein